MNEQERQAALAEDQALWGAAPISTVPTKKKAEKTSRIREASIAEILRHKRGHVTCVGCGLIYASMQGMRPKIIPTYARDNVGILKTYYAEVMSCRKCGGVQFNGTKP